MEILEGRELDTAVAEALGWKHGWTRWWNAFSERWDEGPGWIDPSGKSHPEHPAFHESADLTWAVVDELLEPRKIYLKLQSGPVGWTAKVIFGWQVIVSVTLRVRNEALLNACVWAMEASDATGD